LDESFSEISDGSLLRRYKSGDQAAATRLYLKYAHRLHGLAVAQTGQDLKTRIEPEDIVQSVFRTFFRRAKDGHYQVPDGEELWKLFLVIGLHKIRDAASYHRAEKRNVQKTLSLSDNDQDFAATAPDKLAENTLQIVIDELLQSLNSSQKEIIMLRLEGMTVDDIAESTQRSRRTVERTLQKFRELLQQQLEA
jgi:RNA polymerase sigma-70 factor (ECF subfamily)